MQGYSEYEIENIPSSFPPVLKSLERCIEQVKADKERPRDHIVCGDLTLEEPSRARPSATNRRSAATASRASSAASSADCPLPTADCPPPFTIPPSSFISFSFCLPTAPKSNRLKAVCFGSTATLLALLVLNVNTKGSRL
jgi:hypothetical protein